MLCYSKSESLQSKYPDFIHVNQESNIKSNDDFILVVDTALIKDDFAGFITYAQAISTCKAILCLSATPNFDEGTKLLALGINGYGNIHMLPQNMQAALQSIQSGNIWLYPQFVQMMIQSYTKQNKIQNSVDLSVLTKREREIAMLVKEGFSNKQIASRLDITERTTKAHMSSIFSKLHVSDRVALVIKLVTTPA